MKSGHDYTTLVTSLPRLPYFETAERLPITQLALRQRLSMLQDDDAAQLRLAIEILRWRRHPVAAPTDNFEKQYRAAMQKISNPSLREFVDWGVGARAAVAALRLKLLGHDAPPETIWGAGRLVRMLQKRWGETEAGANALFPWLSEAKHLLETDDAIALERLQMKVVWRRLTALGELSQFGFEYVAAYVFKWDILQRWLSYNPEQAKQKFEKLIAEVIGEHQLACK